MKIGDQIPDLTLLDSAKKEISLKGLKGPLVVYFYPKDETPGCTREACEFRDRYEEFLAFGAQVVGISADSADSHQKFARNHQLPFLLLSDSHGKAERAFGVKRNLLGLLPGRATYIFDESLRLVYVFESQMRFTQHVTEAIATIRKVKTA